MTTCLLVKTQDKRKFLVSEKHLSTLAEFIKTFRAEVYRVELVEGKEIIQLKSLATAICNPDYKPEFKVVKLEKIYPVTRPRVSILKNAKKIRQHIEKRLRDGRPVSLKSLKKRYKNCNITDACLRNHLSAVRKELAIEGKCVSKIGQGTYCLITS
jgi:hypothetical protein